tara:strand:- start:46 stop:882 length:837 start_codon:yes stop_codon:yes gene_type:complete
MFKIVRKNYIYFLIIIFCVIFLLYKYLSSKEFVKQKFFGFFNKPYPVINENFPKIVHLIYFPWERKTGILKPDEMDFDQSFFFKFKKDNPEYKIKLWTLSKIKKFTNEFYPMYNEIWDKIKHPTQAVDFFRLLVVYHYGGIYWQYDSKQKVNLQCFAPPHDKNTRLFVEMVLNKKYANEMKNEPIRKGKPEELVRVSNQCYSALPKDKFLDYCIKKSWKNLNTLQVKSQYDILYIGANAMISEAYDEYKDKNHITLTYNTSKYISFSSNGSWRLDSYN